MKDVRRPPAEPSRIDGVRFYLRVLGNADKTKKPAKARRPVPGRDRPSLRWNY